MENIKIVEATTKSGFKKKFIYLWIHVKHETED
jgi:hypothetical protein